MSLHYIATRLSHQIDTKQMEGADCAVVTCPKVDLLCSVSQRYAQVRQISTGSTIGALYPNVVRLLQDVRPEPCHGCSS